MLLAPADHIRHIETDGARVILDFMTASYLTVDGIGSSFWAVLIGERERETVFTELADCFGVDRVTLQADLSDFAARCRSSGMLVSRRAAPPPLTPVSPPRTKASALHCLIATAWRLRRHGLHHTYSHYSRLAQSALRQATDAELDRAIDSFHFAENFFVSATAPKDCLPRSLALFRYLRAQGFAATHVIGVRRVPFFAHAWVEVGVRRFLCPSQIDFLPISRLPLPVAAP